VAIETHNPADPHFTAAAELNERWPHLWRSRLRPRLCNPPHVHSDPRDCVRINGTRPDF
jgi:hypothetical protein